MTPSTTGAVRADVGLEPEVPPDGIGCRGKAHQLCGRRGDEQRARIQLEEALVAIERLHDDAPGGALDARPASWLR